MVQLFLDQNLPQLEIKDIVKMLWYFVVFLDFFWISQFVEPKLIVLCTIFLG